MTLADVAVTGTAKTTQMATKLEQDEYALDESKVEFDISTLQEYQHKIKSRESIIYFQRLEKISTRVNKVKLAVQGLLGEDSCTNRIKMVMGQDQRKVYAVLVSFLEHVARKEGLQSSSALSVLSITNWSCPSLFSSEHQKLQAAILFTTFVIFLEQAWLQGFYVALLKARMGLPAPESGARMWSPMVSCGLPKLESGLPALESVA